MPCEGGRRGGDGREKEGGRRQGGGRRGLSFREEGQRQGGSDQPGCPDQTRLSAKDTHGPRL